MKMFLWVFATPDGFASVDVKIDGEKPTLEIIRQTERTVAERQGFTSVTLINQIELED